MQDSDWDDLRFFLAVARAGSLAGAAKRLTVNHSTVLRRLGSLEKKLGVQLFDRKQTGYVITSAGVALREQLDGVEERIEAAQRRIGGLDLQPSGTIRLTTTDTLMRGVLMPLLAEFRARQPAIQLQVVVNNTFLSLTKREADVAVRPSNRPPENLIGRRVGCIQSAIYVSRGYLSAHGRKKNLADYDWVAPDEALAHLAQAKWVRERIPEEKIAARLDSLWAMTEAVRHGMGAGLLLCLNAEQEPGLVRLAPPDERLDTDVWVLTHPDLRDVARVKALTDFLYERLVDSKYIVRARVPARKGVPRANRR